jgi:hypothetical protein
MRIPGRRSKTLDAVAPLRNCCKYTFLFIWINRRRLRLATADRAVVLLNNRCRGLTVSYISNQLPQCTFIPSQLVPLKLIYQKRIFVPMDVHRR